MKNLFIFFGEYRTFDTIIQQLDIPSNFDVVFSTWNMSIKYLVGDFDINNPISTQPQRVLRKITNNDIDIHNKNIKTFIHPINKKFLYNTTNMIFHWQFVINSVDETRYDNVILHRCDMLSKINEINLNKIQNHILYCDPGLIGEKGLWMGDYLFLGKFDIIKKFVNAFELIDYTEPHFPLGNKIIELNIQYKSINSCFDNSYSHIIAAEQQHFIDELNKKNIKILDYIGTPLYQNFLKFYGNH